MTRIASRCFVELTPPPSSEVRTALIFHSLPASQQKGWESFLIFQDLGKEALSPLSPPKPFRMFSHDDLEGQLKMSGCPT